MGEKQLLSDLEDLKKKHDAEAEAQRLRNEEKKAEAEKLLADEKARREANKPAPLTEEEKEAREKERNRLRNEKRKEERAREREKRLADKLERGDNDPTDGDVPDVGGDATEVPADDPDKPLELKPQEQKQIAVSLETQTAKIIELLSVWPNASVTTIERYVLETLGSVATRVCIQNAKQEVGLHEPEYTQQTLRKRAFSQAYAINLMQNFGPGGMTEKQLIGRVGAAVLEHFGETANSQLLQNWIKAVIKEVAAAGLTGLNSLVKKYNETLHSFGDSVHSQPDLI